MSVLPDPVYEILSFHQREGVAGPPADLVSVVVTSYDYQDFIEATLDSLLVQTHGAIELVVIDDCSRDRSREVITRWLQRHHGRFLRAILAGPRQNEGLVQSRNAAIRLAGGERIFVLDADNLLLPTCLARHGEVMERTGAAMVYAVLELFGTVSKPGVSDFWDPGRLKHGNYIDAMAMIAKSAWAKVGGYSHLDVVGWEDYEFWIKFIEHGLEGVFIPEVLCRYRVHSGSMTWRETAPRLARMKVEMMARHPWVDLEPIWEASIPLQEARPGHDHPPA